MLEARVFLLSCEHGGCYLPPLYRGQFVGRESLLRSHYGYDPGALSLAKTLAEGLRAPLVESEVSRLLVDLNRSPQSKALFSAQLAPLSEAEKEKILRDYYRPYRDEISGKISAFTAAGAQVVHLSVHSFTPVLRGQVRNTDLGLLYDPSRLREKSFCRDWAALLRQQNSSIKVRYNYPYRGTADGLTRTFRRSFAPPDYLGIELEVNQSLLAADKTFPSALHSCLLETLRELIPVD